MYRIIVLCILYFGFINFGFALEDTSAIELIEETRSDLRQGLKQSGAFSHLSEDVFEEIINKSLVIIEETFGSFQEYYRVMADDPDLFVEKSFELGRKCFIGFQEYIQQPEQGGECCECDLQQLGACENVSPEILKNTLKKGFKATEIFQEISDEVLNGVVEKYYTLIEKNFDSFEEYQQAVIENGEVFVEKSIGLAKQFYHYLQDIPEISNKKANLPTG